MSARREGKFQDTGLIRPGRDGEPAVVVVREVKEDGAIIEVCLSGQPIEDLKKAARRAADEIAEKEGQ